MYTSILRKMQEISVVNKTMSEEDFFQKAVKNIFVKYMGYENTVSTVTERGTTYQIKDMLIKSSTEEKIEKEQFAFTKQLKKNKCTWGILIHTLGMWLFHSELEIRDRSKNNSFTNNNIVLEILYGVNSDQKYFRYFTAENTIGEKKNACFFRDIMDYKLNDYKGAEKSWYAYHSALKRYLAFFAEYKGDYGCDENIYDSMEYSFFVEFINRGTKCKSIKSARNSFFYIKDFMQVKSKRGEFDDPERVKESFPEFMPKYDMQDIMCSDKLREALKFLEKNRNGIRNKAMLLFFLAFGMERRKVCALKWENIHLNSRLLEIGTKKYPIPAYLAEMLEELNRQELSREYVFCNHKGEAFNDSSINSILSQIANVNPKDVFFTQLTPANIRRCLAKYLLKKDYPLQRTLYLMDIEGYKLQSYLSTEEIEDGFWSECRDPIVSEKGKHPLEAFFEKLR